MSIATILDVGRRAKISICTVSRVSNQYPAVSSKHEERVRRAIETLDYSPRQRKASMTALRPLESRNILLLMLGMDLPVVASVIEGAEQAVRESDANLLVSNAPALAGDVRSRAFVTDVRPKNPVQCQLKLPAFYSDTWSTRTRHV